MVAGILKKCKKKADLLYCIFKEFSHDICTCIFIYDLNFLTLDQIGLFMEDKILRLSQII